MRAVPIKIEAGQRGLALTAAPAKHVHATLRIINSKCKIAIAKTPQKKNINKVKMCENPERKLKDFFRCDINVHHLSV